MAKQAYARYLESSHWRETREQALARAGFRCECDVAEDHRGGAVKCGAADSLQVHHRSYDRLGAERPEDLQVLCDRCHVITHLTEAACLRCGNPVFEQYEDAAQAVDGWEGPLWLALCKWLDVPDFCWYCRYPPGQGGMT